MVEWGIAVTVKSPLEEVLAFIAYHLDVGASKIHIFFDDPNDPAFNVVRRLKGVRATICDEKYWERHSGRPAAHQNRQARNALRAYHATSTEWLCHIDIDEFILSERRLDLLLEAVPKEQYAVRMEPFEATYQRSLPSGVFSGRAFRGQILDNSAGAEERVYGRYSQLLSRGMLSHGKGKLFFRTGVKRLTPRIHGFSLGGSRMTNPPFHKNIRLLHFHTQNLETWLAKLHYRLEKGAYRNRGELHNFLLNASSDELSEFYTET